MFTVEWTRESVIAAEAAWDTASPRERERIMNALDYVDRVLADEPENVGESRNDGARILVESPLSVRFMLNVRLRHVRVLSVHVFRHRK